MAAVCASVIVPVSRVHIVAMVPASLIVAAVAVFCSMVTPFRMSFAVAVMTPAILPAVLCALSGPMAPVVIAHRVAMAASIKKIQAIAGIIIMIIPATAKADICKAIAGITCIIIVERGIGVAAIATVVMAVVDIAVAIIACAIETAAQAEQGASGDNSLQGSGQVVM